MHILGYSSKLQNEVDWSNRYREYVRGSRIKLAAELSLVKLKPKYSVKVLDS